MMAQDKKIPLRIETDTRPAETETRRLQSKLNDLGKTVDQTSARIRSSFAGLEASLKRTGETLKAGLSAPALFGTLPAGKASAGNPLQDIMRQAMAGTNGKTGQTETIQAALGLFRQQNSLKIQELEKAHKEEETLLERQRTQSLISEEQYQQQKIQISEQHRQKQSELRRKQFLADKRASEAAALLSVAEGVARALSTAPPQSFVLAAATAALGAAQIAAIESQPVPAFARGTAYAPGGLALVGEEGPELVRLPRGAAVYSAGLTQQLQGRGNGTSGSGLTVELDYDRLAQAMAKVRLAVSVEEITEKQKRLAAFEALRQW